MLRQLDRDCEFLEAEGIMDYSLLIGLHFRNDNSVDEMKSSPRDMHSGISLISMFCVPFSNAKSSRDIKFYGLSIYQARETCMMMRCTHAGMPFSLHSNLSFLLVTYLHIYI